MERKLLFSSRLILKIISAVLPAERRIFPQERRSFILQRIFLYLCVFFILETSAEALVSLRGNDCNRYHETGILICIALPFEL